MDVVDRYFAAINGDRFEDLRDVFAPDVVLEMGAAAPRRGVDDAVAYYALALAPLPEHDDRAVSQLMSDDQRQVAVEIEFEGSTADGRAVAFTAVDLFELDADGRIRRLRSFYDTAKVAALVRPPSEEGRHGT